MGSKKGNAVQPPRSASLWGRVWTWLGLPGNQKTLRFLGAGVAAAIALLAGAGFIGRNDHASGRNDAPAAAAPAAPVQHTSSESLAAPSQNAMAGSGGVAANVLGTGNQVTIGGTRP
ncbi:hypothetical protein QCE62_02210 [Caballeronia sp. LZ033]|uniref:hypothetical protein n=1 Tax=Caballeronia sp. LZ033 TaxID=3038566 RepID=UPI0028648310|nr:hypothetical protein [Caballeronia sp. LZ033]MDR5812403.1 hypothetical protein [Caballeronia sp. LZ033]